MRGCSARCARPFQFESHADDRQVRVTLDESMHALGLPSDRRPTPRDGTEVLAAQPEHQLVAQPPGGTGDDEHRPAVHIDAVRGEAGQRDDGFVFGEHAEREQPVAMLRDGVSKVHFVKRKVTMWQPGRKRLAGGGPRGRQPPTGAKKMVLQQGRNRPQRNALAPEKAFSSRALTDSVRLLAYLDAAEQQIAVQERL